MNRADITENTVIRLRLIACTLLLFCGSSCHVLQRAEECQDSAEALAHANRGLDTIRKETHSSFEFSQEHTAAKALSRLMDSLILSLRELELKDVTLQTERRQLLTKLSDLKLAYQREGRKTEKRGKQASQRTSALNKKIRAIRSSLQRLQKQCR